MTAESPQHQSSQESPRNRKARELLQRIEETRLKENAGERVKVSSDQLEDQFFHLTAMSSKDWKEEHVSSEEEQGASPEDTKKRLEHEAGEGVGGDTSPGTKPIPVRASLDKRFEEAEARVEKKKADVEAKKPTGDVPEIVKEELKAKLKEEDATWLIEKQIPVVKSNPEHFKKFGIKINDAYDLLRALEAHLQDVKDRYPDSSTQNLDKVRRLKGILVGKGEPQWEGVVSSEKVQKVDSMIEKLTGAPAAKEILNQIWGQHRTFATGEDAAGKFQKDSTQAMVELLLDDPVKALEDELERSRKFPQRKAKIEQAIVEIGKIRDKTSEENVGDGSDETTEEGNSQEEQRAFEQEFQRLYYPYDYRDEAFERVRATSEFLNREARDLLVKEATALWKRLNQKDLSNDEFKGYVNRCNILAYKTRDYFDEFPNPIELSEFETKKVYEALTQNEDEVDSEVTPDKAEDAETEEAEKDILEEESQDKERREGVFDLEAIYPKEEREEDEKRSTALSQQMGHGWVDYFAHIRSNLVKRFNEAPTLEEKKSFVDLYKMFTQQPKEYFERAKAEGWHGENAERALRMLEVIDQQEGENVQSEEGNHVEDDIYDPEKERARIDKIWGIVSALEEQDGLFSFREKGYKASVIFHDEYERLQSLYRDLLGESNASQEEKEKVFNQIERLLDDPVAYFEENTGDAVSENDAQLVAKQLKKLDLEKIEEDISRENTPQTPEEKEIVEMVERLPEEEKEKIGWGLYGLTYRIGAAKDRAFEETFRFISERWKEEDKGESEQSTLTRLTRAWSDQFRDNRERARERTLSILKKKEDGEKIGVKARLGVAGHVAAGTLKYMRAVGGALGWSVMSPYYLAMIGSMVARSGLDAGKMARLSSAELKTQTRLGADDLQVEAQFDPEKQKELDDIAQRAWDMYEGAQMRVGEGKKVDMEALNTAYQETIPQDLIRRIKNNPQGGEGTHILQRTFQVSVLKAAEHAQSKLDAIEKSDRSDEEKAREKDAVLNSLMTNKALREFDRMVTEQGHVDQLAFSAAAGERIAKLGVGIMIADTAVRLLSNLPEIASHLDFLGEDEVEEAAGAGAVASTDSVPAASGDSPAAPQDTVSVGGVGSDTTPAPEPAPTPEVEPRIPERREGIDLGSAPYREILEDIDDTRPRRHLEPSWLGAQPDPENPWTPAPGNTDVDVHTGTETGEGDTAPAPRETETDAPDAQETGSEQGSAETGEAGEVTPSEQPGHGESEQNGDAGEPGSPDAASEPGEDPLSIEHLGEPTANRVIGEGSYLSRETWGMVTEGKLTGKELLRAWENPESTVLLSSGERIPITEATLTQSGDHVVYFAGESGEPGRFAIVDSDGKEIVRDSWSLPGTGDTPSAGTEVKGGERTSAAADTPQEASPTTRDAQAGVDTTPAMSDLPEPKSEMVNSATPETSSINTDIAERVEPLREPVDATEEARRVPVGETPAESVARASEETAGVEEGNQGSKVTTEDLKRIPPEILQGKTELNRFSRGLVAGWQTRPEEIEAFLENQPRSYYGALDETDLDLVFNRLHNDIGWIGSQYDDVVANIDDMAETRMGRQQLRLLSVLIDMELVDADSELFDKTGVTREELLRFKDYIGDELGEKFEPQTVEVADAPSAPEAPSTPEQPMDVASEPAEAPQEPEAAPETSRGGIRTEPFDFDRGNITKESNWAERLLRDVRRGLGRADTPDEYTSVVMNFEEDLLEKYSRFSERSEYTHDDARHVYNRLLEMRNAFNGSPFADQPYGAVDDIDSVLKGLEERTSYTSEIGRTLSSKFTDAAKDAAGDPKKIADIWRVIRGGR